MRTLFVSVEMAPIVKVGGLGDVAGSLPKALRALGENVRVALPLTRSVPRDLLQPLTAADISGRGARLLEGRVGGVPVYLVENEEYFGRPEVYGYPDDVERWLFFSRALLALVPPVWQPDFLHLNEFHSSFVAAQLAGGAEHPWKRLASLYTVHNLAIRGDFDVEFLARARLPVEAFAVPGGLDPSLAMNAMALGILNSTAINTVSHTYAEEMLTPEYGAGLDPLLRQRAAEGAVSGIVNGIDYDEWNPGTDRRLPAKYGPDSLEARAENKRVLQAHAGLPERDDVPVIGMVGRLFYQKGADLAASAIVDLAGREDFQFCVLGSGDEENQAVVRDLQSRYPERVSTTFAFDPDLAQLIYGGADMFLMPSRFEPCGLGQLISMRYGCVPIVRRTGGLADTVRDDSEGDGTGFVFGPAEVPPLVEAVERALATYRDRDAWRALQRRGMATDVSWRRAAAEYRDLYAATAGRKTA